MALGDIKPADRYGDGSATPSTPQAQVPAGPLLPGAEYKYNSLMRRYDYVQPGGNKVSKTSSPITPGSTLGSTNTGRVGQRKKALGRGYMPALPTALQRSYTNQINQVTEQNTLGMLAEDRARREAMLRAAQGRQEAGRMAAGSMADYGSMAAEAGIGTSPAIYQAGISQIGQQEMEGYNAADYAKTQALANILAQQQQRKVTTARGLSNLEDWAATQRQAVVDQSLAELLKGGK
jgi:hypothetical protein